MINHRTPFFILPQLLLLFSCSRLDTMFNPFSREEVDTFEREYIVSKQQDTKASHDVQLIQLVGYTTVIYRGKEAEKQKRAWANHQQEIEEAGYYLISGNQARVYFPLSFANVEISGVRFYADSAGFITLPKDQVIPKILVKGREKSYCCKQVIFAKNFSEKTRYVDLSAFVFDLGERQVSCHHSSARFLTKSREEGEGGKIPCTSNHLPASNCTEAFPWLAQGRCETMYDRCMDYNGYGTDCSGSGYFLGSDCCVALANGKCWAEICGGAI